MRFCHLLRIMPCFKLLGILKPLLQKGPERGLGRRPKEGKKNMIRNDLRNVAIIAHVDHGKTTLVDGLLKQGGIYRDNQDTTIRVMDSGDLEKERGITILAKNTAVHYKDMKINIIDTPGHADFGGEVERVLKMVNGVILLVDAAEGPMPQTRFVLQKALALGHRVIVCINKIDKPDARLGEVEDEILELLIDLDASDEQLDSPMLYCSGRDGIASFDPDNMGSDLTPLFDTIVDYIPAPEGDEEGPLQLLVSSIDYSDYVGRIGIGRIERGSIKVGQEAVICNYHSGMTPRKTKIVTVMQIDGLVRKPVETATMGDIVCFSGAGEITIGDTVTAVECPEPLEFVKVSEPTLEMTFAVNDSPLAGKEGKFVTSRQIRDRLYRELLKDVSLRVSDGETTDEFRVAGRGEMHLSILIETMRREGFELTCSNPRVLYKEIDGEKCEPMEHVTLDVPNDYVGPVVEKLGQRKGDLLEMTPMGSGNRMRIEYKIPTRCLFGYRSEFLTATHGEGIMNTLFAGYEPYRGEVVMRFTGSLVASEAGETTRYGLYKTQERGQMFVGPQTPVYEGMIVGENPKNDDIALNPCQTKHMTAVRSTGADEKLLLTPPRIFTLEEAIEYINDDELIEVTPKSIRLRKVILNTEIRMKEMMKKRRALQGK